MKKILIILLILGSNLCSYAFDKELYRMILYRDSMENAFQYKSGLQELPCKIAHLYVPNGFKILDAATSNVVIKDIWKMQVTEGIQATMYPTNGSPFDSRNERYAISYVASGHIYDDEANNLDTSMVTNNSSDTLWKGWKIKPTYDANLHVLYFARNYFLKNDTFERFECTFIFLSRGGYIQMTSHNLMFDYPMIVEDIPAILNAFVFNDGNNYQDFIEKDSEAAFGLNALINPQSQFNSINHSKSSANYFWMAFVAFLFIILGYMLVKIKRKKSQV